MKLYVSADIEGVTGVSSWSETDLKNGESRAFIRQMEKEVLAVCESAYEQGFQEIVVKDAHETGRNMDMNVFPEYVTLMRGWSGDPLSMIEGLDESYDGVAFVGYHSAASRGTSPLSHTLHVSLLNYIKINDQLASEFLIFYYGALLKGVPVVFVSGDEGLCKEIEQVNKNIKTVSTKSAFGKATVNLSPSRVLKNMKDTFSSIEWNKDKILGSLPEQFNVEIAFKNPATAYWASFYPGAELINDTTISYRTKEYMEVLKLFSFVVK